MTSSSSSAVSLLCTLLFIVVVMLCVTSSHSNAILSKRALGAIPCVSCDPFDLPNEVFARRYLGTCMICGQMFGGGIEHCCMCYEEFTKQCMTALKK